MKTDYKLFCIISFYLKIYYKLLTSDTIYDIITSDKGVIIQDEISIRKESTEIYKKV